MITINGHKVTPTIFPDKTSQVWKLPDELFTAVRFDIEWKFENEAEFIWLAQLKELLDNTGNRSTYLSVPYFPYARQDKEIGNTTTFALHTFCWLLNSLNFTKIVTSDLHSNFAKILLPNLIDTKPDARIETVFRQNEYDVKCYPDKGALDRYHHEGDVVCVGTKTRDQSTGMITGYVLAGDVKDKSVLIVDDICDGGATFIHLAEHLKHGGAKRIGLYVSHGIFSKGTKVLRDAGIQQIFTLEREIE